MYRPPKVHVSHLITSLEHVCEKCICDASSLYIIGDLNVDMMTKSNALADTLDVFNLRNVVRKPTCFKNVLNPSLLDVILTNTPRRLTSVLNVSLGISDFHNFICLATKMCKPKEQISHIVYRSYKHFNEELYLKDLQSAPFHVSNVFTDVDDQYWFYCKMLNEIIDQHAPLKKRTVQAKQLPYMNDALRKAINVKGSLRRRFNKTKSNYTWRKYRNQRNYVTKLKRSSLQKYFNKECNEQSKTNKTIWNVVRPFISNKGNMHYQDISLYEQNRIMTDPVELCNVFNDHFSDIASNQCESDKVISISADETIQNSMSHSSIQTFKESIDASKTFTFKTVTPDLVFLKLKHLNVKKACGYAGIPAKLLNIGSTVINVSLTPIINASITSLTFPNDAKRAEISPLFKTNDNLSKNNYRPLSILTALSKILEGLICDQLSCYMNDIMSMHLSDYRKRYSCNNLLIKCIEEIRKSLDNGEYVGCLLIDLSNALDSIPHSLLLAKLNAYGVSLRACSYVQSYLSNRKHRDENSAHSGEWSVMKRGVPQCSLTGPLLFNICINDYILSLDKICSVYNYADDNTLCCANRDRSIVSQIYT